MLISIRYSCARRQFGPPSQASMEIPVLDYPLQQVRLMPFLSGAIMCHLFTGWIVEVCAYILVLILFLILANHLTLQGFVLPAFLFGHYYCF